jgi:hypothetical protein
MSLFLYVQPDGFQFRGCKSTQSEIPGWTLLFQNLLDIMAFSDCIWEVVENRFIIKQDPKLLSLESS